MTRIVAGSAKGRTLKVPQKGTRPTSERVREALFSRLDHWGVLDDATVLDLYAGSGALGLEALSRGAASAALVEKHHGAVAALRHNLAATSLPGRVIAQDVHSYLAGRAGTPPLCGDISLVFIDPPYDIPETELTTTLELLIPWLTPDALVIVERSSRSPQPTWPAALTLEDTSTWGETTAYFAGPPPTTP